MEEEALPTGHAAPPRPLYLVVGWDPWNWAAVAVSQELLPEAERDVRGRLSSCARSWGGRGAEGDHLLSPDLWATRGLPGGIPATC